jgi:hypothetical protein
MKLQLTNRENGCGWKSGSLSMGGGSYVTSKISRINYSSRLPSAAP